MSGKEFKDQLEADNVVLADLARGLNISPQALNSKLKAKNLTAKFIEEVNKIVYKSSTNEKGAAVPAPSENEIFRMRVELDLLRSIVKDLQKEIWELQNSKLDKVTYKKKEEGIKQGK